MILSQKIPVDSDLHKKICGQLREFHKLADRNRSRRKESWARAENQMIAAIPERDIDRLRKQREEAGGDSEYVTVTIPYTYAAVMASHSYFTSVFLSRDPVYQYSGRHGEAEEKVQALEALQHYNLTVGRQLPNLFTWFYDAPKYGEAIVGLHWAQEKNTVSKIVEEEETSLGIATGNLIRRKVTEQLKGFEGVKLFNVQPQRFLTDPAFPRAQFQKGRFCAVITEDLTWNQFLRGEADGRYINKEAVRKRGSSGNGEDRETQDGEGSGLERPQQYDEGQVSTFSAPGSNVANPSFVKHYEFYVELVPNEWGVGKSPYPEKWVFSVTKDFTTLFEARPLGYYHNKYPFAVLEAEPEGYGAGSRSFVDVLEPVQHTLDWLVNSHFFNVRAALNNSYVYDPSRVSRRDVESRRAGKAIQLKPSAYGTDPRAALYQLQTADVTGSHLNDIDLMYGVGERVGFNDKVLGVGSPTSRRSATEVRGDNNFSVGRLKTTSEFFSATGWADLCMMSTSMQQQYYDSTLKLKIVGDLAEAAGEGFLQVDAEAISGFYDPVPVDGTLPIDRFAQANLWRELMGQVAEVPAIAGEYSMPKIFSWVAKLMGLKNIDRMKVQVGSPEMIGQDVQAGNAVALNEGEDIPLPAQLSGQGPIG